MNNRSIRLLALALAASLAGCADKSGLAEFCAAHPGMGPAEPVRTGSYYRAPWLRGQSWLDWAAIELLDRGATVVETSASSENKYDTDLYLALSDYDGVLHFEIAPLSDPGCARTDALLAKLHAHDRELRALDFANRGLRSDECLATTFAPEIGADFALEIRHLNGEKPAHHGATGLAEWQDHYVFRALHPQRMLAEYWDAGYSYRVTAGGNPVTTCNRSDDFYRFRDLLLPLVETDPRLALIDASEMPPFPEEIESAPRVVERIDPARADVVARANTYNKVAHSTVPYVTMHPEDETRTTLQAPQSDGRWRRVQIEARYGRADNSQLFELDGRIAILSITKSGPDAIALEFTTYSRDLAPQSRRYAQVEGIGRAKNRRIALWDIEVANGAASFTVVELGDAVRKGFDSTFPVLAATRYEW